MIIRLTVHSQTVYYLPDSRKDFQMNRNEKLKMIVLTLFVDVALPSVVYFILRQFGMSDVLALAFGSGVSVIRIILEFVRNRKIDALAFLMFLFFLVGIATSFFTGNARFMIAKDSLFTGIFALVMIGSAFVGRRPLIFYLGRQFAGSESFEQKWNELERFRHNLRVMTVVWGIGYLIEAIVRVIVVFTLSISMSVLVSPLLLAFTTLVLIVWTRLFVRHSRSKGKKTHDTKEELS